MTICFITPEYVTEESYFDGGLANYLFRVAISLRNMNHEPMIVVSSNKNKMIMHNLIQVHRVQVYDKIYYSLSNTSRWIYQSFLLNQYVKNLTSSRNIDLIQYTNYTATGLYRILNIPSVTRISSWNPLLAKYYDLEPSDDTNRFSLLERISLKNSDAVFGPSKIEANCISESEKINVKIIESPYINDVEKYDYSLYQTNLAGKKYLLFFGTLGVLKGLLTISDIIHELLDSHRDIYFVFIGKDVGYNSKKVVDILKDKAGIFRDRIVYFDKQKHDKLYPVIEKSYAVILPSRIDNFPNSAIEAMAHGKIVIGTKDTGFEQLIEDKKDGFLCERDDPGDLLEKIRYVLSIDENEKKSIELNSYRRVLLLRPELSIGRLIDFYHDVVSKFKPKQKSDSYDFNDQLNSELINICKDKGLRNGKSLILLLRKALRKTKNILKLKGAS